MGQIRPKRRRRRKSWYGMRRAWVKVDVKMGRWVEWSDEGSSASFYAPGSWGDLWPQGHMTGSGTGRVDQDNGQGSRNAG